MTEERKLILFAAATLCRASSRRKVCVVEDGIDQAKVILQRIDER